MATTGGSRLKALRKGVKVRHVAGVFLVAFLVVLPNTWFAVDAGSPFEVKEELEEQVLRVTPEFLRPPGAGEGLFYFGAFGFTLPLPNRYFPQAWSWLRQQDTEVIPVWERPAFLSWWDYGFEAIQEGRHPTVADNFQNGLEYSGHFLTSLTENEGIAVLNVRLLLGDVVANRGAFSAATEAVLVAHGFDPDHVLDALQRPALFIPLIRAEPERFREWDDRLSGRNARIIYLRTVFVEALGLEAQVDFYRDLRTSVDASIGYFAVDSRLIPFSGTNTGIFYAVAKLTDHRTTELPDGRSIPVDFYRLIAVTPGGEFDLDQLPPGTGVTDIRIEYLDPWYHTMLYRIFFGPDGESLGIANDGLPVFSGELASTEPRHGWMLQHFKMVYRTAYFNPHPPDQIANFTEEFTALNVFDALELQRQIAAGEIEGTVDVSARSGLQSGIVFLQFFDGALIRGRVTTEAGTPMAGVRVTVLDELLTPHSITFADSDGSYEAILPFGNTTLVISTGLVDNATGIGTFLLEQQFDVSQAQALRIPLDESGTGLPSFVIEEDFVVEAASFRGTAFMDVNGNGAQDPEEPGLPGLQVAAVDIAGDAPEAATVTGPDGSYALGDLVPTRYRLSLARNGGEIASLDLTVSQGEDRTQDLPVSGATLSGALADEFGLPPIAGTVRIVEQATGEVTQAIADGEGIYLFEGLFEGTYTVEADAEGRGTFPQLVVLVGGSGATLDLLVEPLASVTGRTLLSFAPTAHVTVSLQRQGDARQLMLTSDADGRFEGELPLGTYDAYALHFAGGRVFGFLGPVEVVSGSQSFDFNLRTASRVAGGVSDQNGEAVQATLTFETAGARHVVMSGTDGAFVTFLPSGQFQLVALNATGHHVSTVTVSGSTELTVSLVPGVATPGRVFRDLNGNGTFDPGEGLPGVRVLISTPSAPTFIALTATDGAFETTLVEGANYVWTIEDDAFESVSIGPSPPRDLGARAPIELVARNVSVAGQLTALAPLDLSGLNVTLEAVSSGAVSATLVTGSQGGVSGSVQPGIYALVVDAEAPPGDGGRRIQGDEEAELRVPVGGGTEAFGLSVVERVRLQGTLTSGSLVGVAILFEGPDRAFVKSDEEYLVYLKPGTYTVSGATDFPSSLALLTTLDVTDPATFNATFQAAATLDGQLKVNGTNVTAEVTLAFTRVSDGARVLVPGSTEGYETILVPATYRVTAEWEGVDRLDEVNRFVRYTLDQTVVLADNGTTDLLFARALDTRAVEVHVLLAGQLTSAHITFQAANETAINVTVDVPAGAPFLANLAPGRYHVYAFRDIGNSAALTELEVVPNDPASLAIALEQGYRVFGVAILSDGSRRTTQLGFRSLAGSASFTTDAQGGYEIYLPAGAYDLLALSKRDEGGVLVEYRFEDGVDLRDSTLLNPLLSRVDVRTLEVTWDPDQRTLVAPGETFVYTVAVTNTGNMADTFRLDGFPSSWLFSFRPSRVSLPFGSGTSAQVTVQITAPEDAEAPEGTLSVVARSTTDPLVSGLGSLFVDVVQFRDLALELGTTPPVLSGETIEYQVEVKNEGNGEDTFGLVLTNPEVLAVQGWRAELEFEGQTSPDNITGIVIPARDSRPVTLRLRAEGRVSTSTATFLAFSEDDRKVESSLDVAVGFPSLQIPSDELRIEGKRVRIGPPEFPILLYGALAAAAVGLTVLFLTYGRRRRRR
ncbi:MAG: SdrD B-like domain-containing protein [Thermoplasmata archaeon]